jgi:hypothetical protein
MPTTASSWPTFGSATPSARRSAARRWWIRILAIVADALVATGILVPIDVEIAALTTFVGYLLRTAWVVGLAVHLLVRNRQMRDTVPSDEVATDESARVGSSEWDMT